MEILFRELLRLFAALINALLSQSWRPLEGALGESGANGVALLLLFGAGLLLLVAALAVVLAWLLFRRIRTRRMEPAAKPVAPGN